MNFTSTGEKIKKFFGRKGVVEGILILGIVFNIFAMSFFALHKDVNFISDVSRDFLLYQEIDVKKIVLIGPRSSTEGIFHGPLWLYLNYPSYLLGHGDPVVVGYFWLFLGVAFLGCGYFVANKLFGKTAALVYVLLLSGNMIFLTSGMFNPHGALFLMPFFFLTIFLYQKLQKWWYLAIHIFLAGLIIQFQMAVGIPLLLLSGAFVLFSVWKSKKYLHLLLFAILIPTLSTFFIFELRHGFTMTKSILHYASPEGSNGQIFDYAYMIYDRIDRLLQAYFGQGMTAPIVGFVFAIVAILTYIEIKTNPKTRSTYLLILYYYVGYVALTFVNKGPVLEHQFFPILALTDLWLASLVVTKHKYLFAGLITLIFLFNFNYAREYLKKSQDFVGKDISSWRFLSQVAEDISKRQNGKDFGYFVYSPDAFAYQPRYAMIYNFKKLGANAKEYVKEPVTYIISAPDASHNPFVNREGWIREKTFINAKPVWSKDYLNGYLIEEFKLKGKNLETPHDRNIELGIHFR